MRPVQLPASFKDASGFIFQDKKRIYRTVNQIYREHFDHLIESGLYRKLVKLNYLIPHQEIKKWPESIARNGIYKIIEPQIVPFISYPYEWSYSQYWEAAALTLKVQKKAMDFGMTLKDASAFNIQFMGTEPLLIDTLSFEKSDFTAPWIAYRQFCQHFLAPLVLMKNKDLRFGRMTIQYLDGIPLDLTVKLLPKATFANVNLLINLYFHEKGIRRFEQKSAQGRPGRITPNGFRGVIDSLEASLNSLKVLDKSKTNWSSYYQEFSYSVKTFNLKKNSVEKFLAKTFPRIVLDLGANTGEFSRIAATKAELVISVDNDPLTLDINFRLNREKKVNNIISLIVDLTNPSPALGFLNLERQSFIDRVKPDTILALALIHHLFFSNNWSFSMMAQFFRKLAVNLIIEFIPLDDPQIKRISQFQKIDKTLYQKDNFEKSFVRYYKIMECYALSKQGRVLYLMEGK